MHNLFFDIETRSRIPISNGAYAYAEDAEILIFSWAIDDNDVQQWFPLDEPLPPRGLESAFSHSLAGPMLISLNGVGFDLPVIRRKLGWNPPWSRIHDCMIQAYMHALPGGLSDLCKAFTLPEHLSKQAGSALIKLFCVPDKSAIFTDPSADPAKWSAFVKYAEQDVIALRELYKLLPRWNCRDWWMLAWREHERANAKGVHIDLDFVKRAIVELNDSAKENDEQVHMISAGRINSTRQVAGMVQLLKDWYPNLRIQNMQEPALRKILEDPETDEDLYRILELRFENASASTAKYKKAATMQVEGVLRGLDVFCGASRTGRTAGRGVQRLNLPRSVLSPLEVEHAIRSTVNGTLRVFDDRPQHTLTQCIRGMFIPRPGHRFCIADWTSIESRILAWLAGEVHILDRFQAFDQGDGPDEYVLTFSDVFGTPVEKVSKSQRQIGKAIALAFGYGGGVGAFKKMAEGVFSLDLPEIARIAMPPEWAVDAAEKYAAQLKKEKDLPISRPVFIKIDAIKRAWRQSRPKTVQFWRDLETAAYRAGSNRSIFVGACKVRRHGGWLLIQLPCGRYLSYPKFEAGEKLSYWAKLPLSPYWGRVETYGGKLAENLAQAFSSSVLWATVLRLRGSKFKYAWSAYDEIITEVEGRMEHHDELCRIMSQPHAFAPGLPLAATGFTADRYRKG